MNGKVRWSVFTVYNANHSGWFQGSSSPSYLLLTPHTCEYLFLLVEKQET